MKTLVKETKKVEFKRLPSKKLVETLREAKIAKSEKDEIISILQKRKVEEVVDFLPKRRGRKPIEGRDGDNHFPRGARVRFEVYRKPGQFRTGRVTANSTSYVDKKTQTTNYLLSIEVEKDGKKEYISKNSKNVELVK